MSDSPLVRQWILLRTLSSRRRGVSVCELAGEMEVTEKTIRRYLSAFRAAGFLLIEEVGEHGRKSYRLDGRASPELAFTYDEAFRFI